MSRTDIAIVGMACRFPAADSPREFWRVIRDGLEVTESPPEHDRAARLREGLLDNVAEFDAEFFNVSPREARMMDPRQRIALELVWELVEDAFVVPETLRGQQVGVYVGAMTDDYAILTARGGSESPDHHSFAGISRAMISNRISYAFGMHGPSLSIDAAQSSSLLAVHLACESLRHGEVPLAVAGGVHLNLASETGAVETEFGAESPSGHTYAFDERADGYVRSEGGGFVLLKPLNTALDDGNRIHAIIRGSAAGNAGHNPAGLTVPSVDAQVDVIRRALSVAGLASNQIDYIEAHGTGTRVGDPVEARALGELFTERQHSLCVGSVKTNIGHTGGAAGIAGLLKAVLAIEAATIPPSLNYADPNPEIDWERGLQVCTALTPWPIRDAPRRAGVSSFGMGGTNVHVVIEQAPDQNVDVAQPDSAFTAWVVSARSPQALVNQAQRLLAQVSAEESLRLRDVGWSLAATRSVFEHRAVVMGTDRAGVLSGLAELTSGGACAEVITGHARLHTGRTVFVFPGQGAQRLGMGRQLHSAFPPFAQAFDHVTDVLDGLLRHPLKEVMWGRDMSLLENTEFAQPALFAIEVALVALLQHWGVLPDLVLGHSVGEITAAYTAGVLTLEDAARLVAERGRLMASLPEDGAMVAVAAGEDEVLPLLTDDVGIAAVNGPDAVVVSGREAAVLAVANQLEQRGRRVHRLAVSHAFHSVLMEPMQKEFARVAAGVKAAPPRIDLLSNVSGQVAGPRYGSAQYWLEHLRSPVRFARSVLAAESLGAQVFIEVGPGGGLSAAVEQSLTTERAVSVVALHKDRSETDSLLAAVARLFVHGISVDWPTILAGGQRVDLPTYGFARQRFWLDDEKTGGAVADTTTSPSPSFAGRLARLAPKDQRRQLVDLVCTRAATVLGHSNGDHIDAERAFSDHGFDSLTGVELRNRLSSDTGLALSRTLIFDFPNPKALADHLAQQLSGDHRQKADDEEIWAALKTIPIQELRRTGLLDKLLLLAGGSEKPDTTVSDEVIDSLSADALIAMTLNADKDDGVS